VRKLARIATRRDGYQGIVESGFLILSDRSIRGPTGKTGWFMSGIAPNVEAVWGRSGDLGWRLAGGLFHEPNGSATSYFVVPDGDVRVIHGPEPKLPWM
jgi:hypothetical protein